MLISISTIGYIAAFLTTVAYIPQALKTLHTKSSKDISLLMYILIILGTLSWVLYGAFTNSLPILLANAIVFVIVCYITIIILIHRLKK